jgi:hypothetical protein
LIAVLGLSALACDDKKKDRRYLLAEPGSAAAPVLVDS